MEVDYIGKSKGKGKSKSKSKGNRKGNSKGGSKDNGKGKSKGKSEDRNQGKSNGKGNGKPDIDKECYLGGKKGHLARDCWSRANHDKMVNEVEVENVNAEPVKEYVLTVENEINDVNLIQDGCVEREDGLVMIDSGASVNVCPKWFGNSKLEQSDGATCLRGANGKPLQENGNRQIWLRFCGQAKRYDFHLVNVTEPILSVSCLCEQGVETHLAKKSVLRFGDGHEPLIRKGGVHFVKAQTVNAVENTTRDKSQERCERADGSEKSCVQADGLQKSCVQADGLKNSCVQADGLKMSCVQADGLQNSCVRADERSEKSCVRADGRSEKSCVRADGRSNKSCARVDGSEKSWARADERSENACVRADGRTEKFMRTS